MKSFSQKLKWIVMLCAMMVCNGAWAQIYVWQETALNDLVTGDVVVIVDKTSSNAMTNNEGQRNAPAASSVTLDSGRISSHVTSNIQWEVTDIANTDFYQFNVPGTEDYLYCISEDDGLRVGTNNDNNFFSFEQDLVNLNVSSAYYLRNPATGRFVGVSDQSGWRCFTSVNDIRNVVTAFYKRVESSTTAVTITISDSHLVNKDIYENTSAGKLEAIVVENGTTINNPYITWTSSNTSVATINPGGHVELVAAGTTTITAEYEGYIAEYVLNVIDSTPHAADITIQLNNAFFSTYYEGDADDISKLHPVSGTLNDVTVEYGGNGSHYIDNERIGFQAKNTLTFTAPEGYFITKIAFVVGTAEWYCSLSSSIGTITDNNTWTGKTKAVELSGGGGGTSYMSKVVISVVPEGEEVTVEGTLAAGKYATRIFPFTPTTIQGVTFYNCRGVYGNALALEEVYFPEANTPYILGNETEADIDITQTGADNHQADTYVSVSGLLVGTFVNKEINSGYVLQTQGGKQSFYKVGADNPITVPPYRAYLDYYAEIKALGFDDATAINALDALTSGSYEGIYTVDGVKLNHMEKGVNILKMADGTTRKVIVK